ncbi:alpha/beta fold hydrolase [Streptomyces carpaticus]|uniref:Alpha/beta fold hydrolase n=1 Tax=Streptomyces carpaticus TaxID=285558 RepID=A0ABV4ZNW0_9ACTN
MGGEDAVDRADPHRRPAGPTGKDPYAAWLAGELRAIGGPVDVVGHDWGGHLTMRVASARTDVPLRGWVSDVAHGWHPDYTWHEAATLWQRSPEGEESPAGLREAPSGSGRTFGDLLRGRGMTPELGREADAIHDAEMSAAILAPYRSARPNLAADWGKDLAGPPPRPDWSWCRPGTRWRAPTWTPRWPGPWAPGWPSWTA